MISFRQLAVCAIVGPICALWFVALLGIVPMMALIGWLVGDSDPVMAAWEIASEPPLDMFQDVYRGR